MSMNTGLPTPETIDEYIGGFPPEIRAILEKIRATIRKAAPGAEEAVKYGLATFVLHGNLVHFGAFKHHIGFYPTPSGTEEFRSELSQYKTSKGAIQFPLDKPVPLALITRIVKFRVKESMAKMAGGKKK